MPHRLQYKTLESAPLRRAGRHTDPPKNSVAAVRAAAMPGRRILNAAGAGQGPGSPASADARPAGGGREAEGRFGSPAPNTAREGGTRRAHRLSVLDSSGQTSGVKKGPEGPLERVPYFPLFCVVVRYIFYTRLLHVIHHCMYFFVNAHSIFDDRECVVVQLIDAPVGGAVAPPAQTYKIHRILPAACLSPVDDMVNLQAVCAITQGTAEAIPFVYVPPDFIADICVHVERSFLPPFAAPGAHHTSARAAVWPLVLTLAPCGTMDGRRMVAYLRI